MDNLSILKSNSSNWNNEKYFKNQYFFKENEDKAVDKKETNVDISMNNIDLKNDINKYSIEDSILRVRQWEITFFQLYRQCIEEIICNSQLNEKSLNNLNSFSNISNFNEENFAKNEDKLFLDFIIISKEIKNIEEDFYNKATRVKLEDILVDLKSIKETLIKNNINPFKSVNKFNNERIKSILEK